MCTGKEAAKRSRAGTPLQKPAHKQSMENQEKDMASQVRALGRQAKRPGVPDPRLTAWAKPWQCHEALGCV